MNKTLAVIATLATFLSQITLAQAACNVGVYSKYVGAVDGVPEDRPVMQGDCTKAFASGAYVNGWFSQSLRDPGLSKTFGNELDLTFGWADKISEKWSADVHTAFYDMTNPRLLNGTNGDLANIGGTLSYHATSSTRVYANLEGFHGIGERGFPGGWTTGFGVQTQVGPVNVNGTLSHNHNFMGHGEFLKFSLEPVAPLWQSAGYQVRPNVTFWQPIGSYGETHDKHVVVGVRIDW